MCSQLVVENHLLRNLISHFLVRVLPTMHTRECSLHTRMLPQQTLICSICIVVAAGRIPLDPRLTQCLEDGKSFVDTYPGTPTEAAVAGIVRNLLSETANTNHENEGSTRTPHSS